MGRRPPPLCKIVLAGMRGPFCKIVRGLLVLKNVEMIFVGGETTNSNGGGGAGSEVATKVPPARTPLRHPCNRGLSRKIRQEIQTNIIDPAVEAGYMRPTPERKRFESKSGALADKNSEVRSTSGETSAGTSGTLHFPSECLLLPEHDLFGAHEAHKKRLFGRGTAHSPYANWECEYLRHVCLVAKMSSVVSAADLVLI